MTILKKNYTYISSKINWVLLGIIIIGSILRLVNLNNVPSGLHFDEAQSGYNAFTLSKHLKNIQGEFLPTDIDYFQDFRPAGNSYLTALTVGIFGLNETTIRLPAAIFGILTIYLTYLIAFKIFKKKRSRLLFCISDRHFTISHSFFPGLLQTELLTYFGYCFQLLWS